MSSDTLQLKHRMKQIAVNDENYFRLKRLGQAGDSFNDVITRILRNPIIQEENVVAAGEA